MTNKIRITQAYCLELDRTVTIDEARMEYLSQTGLPKKYHFFCADLACKNKRVRITGVNYWRSAEESKKHRIAHFRELDIHQPDCAWVTLSEKANYQGLLPGETEEDAKKRLARTKLTDFIDVFDPYLDDETQGLKTSKIELSSDNKTLQNPPENSISPNNSPISGYNQTNRLGRLVESYREAKSKLSEEDFKSLELKVKGLGTEKIHPYFKHFKYGWNQEHKGVLFGGAKAEIKRYGLGFRLHFYDQIEKHDVFLYISPEKMNNYRYRRYLDKELQRDDIRYLHLYFIPDQITSHINKQNKLVYNVEINDLRHLVIIIEPKEKGKEE